MNRLSSCRFCSASALRVIRYCHACGADLADPLPIAALTSLGVESDRIWLTDLGVDNRTSMLLARAGHHVVGDLTGLTDADVEAIPKLGRVGLSHVLERLEAVRRDPETITRQCEERRGTWRDPLALVFGEAFMDDVHRFDVDLTRMPIQSLRIPTRSMSLLRAAKLVSLAELAIRTNLELVRRCDPSSVDFLQRLPAAATAALAGAPTTARRRPIVTDGLAPAVGQPVAVAAPSSRVSAVSPLEEALSGLMESRRSVISLRFGLDGSAPLTREQIGLSLDVTRERIRQIEGKAIIELHGRRRVLESAFGAIAIRRQELGLAWDDPRLVDDVVTIVLPTWTTGAVRLVLALFADRQRVPLEVTGVDEAVAVALARLGPLSDDDLEGEVRPLLDPAQLRDSPRFSVAQRAAALGTAIRLDDGRLTLSTVAAAEGNRRSGRRARRLAAVVAILERVGSSHFREIAREAAATLSTDDTMSDDDVRNMLTDDRDRFVWVGQGTYALSSSDLGISAVGNGDGPAPEVSKGRRGCGDGIERLLLERGPMALNEVAAHILPLYSVLPSSVLQTIKYDKRGRFALGRDRVVSLRAPSHPHASDAHEEEQVPEFVGVR